MSEALQGEIHELTVHGRLEGQQALNVMFFQATTTSDTIETQLLRAMIICLTTTLIPGLGSNYTLEKVASKRVYPTLGPIIELAPLGTDDVTGESAGDTLPSFVSALISIQTTRGGRSGRGRMFIPGIPEGSTSGSSILTESPAWGAIVAYVACVAAQFLKSVDLPANDQWNLGVLSRKLGNDKPPYLLAQFAPATSLIPKRLLSTTRSRKVGHGG